MKTLTRNLETSSLSNIFTWVPGPWGKQCLQNTEMEFPSSHLKFLHNCVHGDINDDTNTYGGKENLDNSTQWGSCLLLLFFFLLREKLKFFIHSMTISSTFVFSLLWHSINMRKELTISWGWQTEAGIQDGSGRTERAKHRLPTWGARHGTSLGGGGSEKRCPNLMPYHGLLY